MTEKQFFQFSNRRLFTFHWQFQILFLFLRIRHSHSLTNFRMLLNSKSYRIGWLKRWKLNGYFKSTFSKSAIILLIIALFCTCNFFIHFISFHFSSFFIHFNILFWSCQGTDTLKSCKEECLKRYNSSDTQTEALRHDLFGKSLTLQCTKHNLNTQHFGVVSIVFSDSFLVVICVALFTVSCDRPLCEDDFVKDHIEVSFHFNKIHCENVTDVHYFCWKASSVFTHFETSWKCTEEIIKTNFSSEKMRKCWQINFQLHQINKEKKENNIIYHSSQMCSLLSLSSINSNFVFLFFLKRESVIVCNCCCKLIHSKYGNESHFDLSASRLFRIRCLGTMVSISVGGMNKFSNQCFVTSTQKGNKNWFCLVFLITFIQFHFIEIGLNWAIIFFLEFVFSLWKTRIFDFIILF